MIHSTTNTQHFELDKAAGTAMYLANLGNNSENATDMPQEQLDQVTKTAERLLHEVYELPFKPIIYARGNDGGVDIRWWPVDGAPSITGGISCATGKDPRCYFMSSPEGTSIRKGGVKCDIVIIAKFLRREYSEGIIAIRLLYWTTRRHAEKHQELDDLKKGYGPQWVIHKRNMEPFETLTPWLRAHGYKGFAPYARVDPRFPPLPDTWKGLD